MFFGCTAGFFGGSTKLDVVLVLLYGNGIGIFGVGVRGFSAYGVFSGSIFWSFR